MDDLVVNNFRGPKMTKVIHTGTRKNGARGPRQVTDRAAATAPPPAGAPRAF